MARTLTNARIRGLRHGDVTRDQECQLCRNALEVALAFQPYRSIADIFRPAEQNGVARNVMTPRNH